MSRKDVSSEPLESNGRSLLVQVLTEVPLESYFAYVSAALLAAGHSTTPRKRLGLVSRFLGVVGLIVLAQTALNSVIDFSEVTTNTLLFRTTEREEEDAPSRRRISKRTRVVPSTKRASRHSDVRRPSPRCVVAYARRQRFDLGVVFVYPSPSEVVAEWTDDEVFAWGNRPYYTYFQHIYHYILWVARPTLFSLLLCSFLAAIAIGAELRQTSIMCEDAR